MWVVLLTVFFSIALYAPPTGAQAIITTATLNPNQVAADAQKLSWAKLQAMPNILCSVSYGNFRVNIFEHTDNQMISPKLYYFYAPIAQLNQKSTNITSSINNITNRAEVRFQIEMWNEQIQGQVVEHLTQFVGQVIQTDQVQVLPFEKIFLSSMNPTTDFSLPSDWLPYSMQKTIQFTVSCVNKSCCDTLATNMQERSLTDQLIQFKLLYGLGPSQQKTGYIRQDLVNSGNLVTDLRQRFQQDEVWLTSKDVDRLVLETKTNIYAETFQDSDVVSKESDSPFNNLITNSLIGERTTIGSLDNATIFWDSSNPYRPDLVGKALRGIYEGLNTADEKGKLVKLFENNDEPTATEQETFLVLVPAGNAQISKVFKPTNANYTKKFYQESKKYMEWDEVLKTFLTNKPFFFKLNLKLLRDQIPAVPPVPPVPTFKQGGIMLRYSTAVLTTPLNFLTNLTQQQKDDLNFLKDEFKKNKEDVKKQFEESKNQTDVELAKKAAQSELDAIIGLNRLKTLNPVSKPTDVTTNINKMPTSCEDLNTNGNNLNGFFSVLVSDVDGVKYRNKKIKTVYCNFEKRTREQGFETSIGYNDVKSQMVYFYVQRKDIWSMNLKSGIPFGTTIVNKGGAFKSDTGVFTAPVPGKYFFSISGNINYNTLARVELQLKTERDGIWKAIGHAFGQWSYETLSLQSTLDLDVKDEIRLLLVEGTINPAYFKDSANMNFNGWLIEENLPSSLE